MSSVSICAILLTVFEFSTDVANKHLISSRVKIGKVAERFFSNLNGSHTTVHAAESAAATAAGWLEVCSALTAFLNQQRNTQRTDG